MRTIHVVSWAQPKEPCLRPLARPPIDTDPLPACRGRSVLAVSACKPSVNEIALTPLGSKKTGCCHPPTVALDRRRAASSQSDLYPRDGFHIKRVVNDTTCVGTDYDPHAEPSRTWACPAYHVCIPTMDRRNRSNGSHPPVSGFACPECAGAHVRLATVAERFFYLRCEACLHVWLHAERRRMVDRRRVVQPVRDAS